jgi:glycosyltransferase involved in cell wall biosynthesis
MTIDIHILHIPNRDILSDECLASLKDEKDTAVIIERTENILNARLRVIENSQAEFISFVDDDDEVVPGIYAKLIAALEDKPEYVGAHAWEITTDEHGTPIWPAKHALHAPFDLLTAMTTYRYPRPFILRASVAKSIAEFMRALPAERTLDLYVDFTIFALASLIGPWHQVPEVGYLYRQHRGNTWAHQSHAWMRNATKMLLMEAATALTEATNAS